MFFYKGKGIKKNPPPFGEKTGRNFPKFLFRKVNYYEVTKSGFSSPPLSPSPPDGEGNGRRFAFVKRGERRSPLCFAVSPFCILHFAIFNLRYLLFSILYALCSILFPLAPGSLLHALFYISMIFPPDGRSFSSYPNSLRKRFVACIFGFQPIFSPRNRVARM